ncbi:hypothetical protein G6F70_000521 [Rhizopus microsporus]|uniref:CHCH domain-containing protein n=1 Tax=Rhizopus microsporus TaxID=58291 RepID=A0A1X0S6V2_RHIZD|nr:hypothetical protein G6F71_001492 [Rhizopus microsporus]KAG1204397.1 hypothetical protein G6F70_000521 [Rhizopus microsporus]KAG1215077.1 hypothetical protein G6F69_001341 [Rhizopus microsporus]KAG1237445.1 hypothetical protein G6F67_001201 [Rhizopus microsporus]KAG1269406.1 hypothetical protein G6F68_000313 [Rhizopus microsporus]
MPRSSRSSRPAARPARPSGPSHQQTRSAHTHAPPPQQHTPVQQQQRQPSEAAQHRQPGLFGQMASTAAGVAVGSAVGHTMANGVSSMFGGGRQSEEVQQQQATYQASSENVKNSCEADAKAFTQCLDATNNDMSACKWYLDALKQCQQMASQY